MAFNYRDQLQKELLYSKRRENRVLRWEEIHNPIPESLDESDYEGIFNVGGKEKYFVPYAGWDSNSVHSYLDHLITVADLAPTHGSCINSQSFLCFGGPLDVVGQRRQFVFDDPGDLSDADKLSYVDTISKWIPGFDPKAIMERAFVYGKMTGDRWYLVEGNSDFARVEVVDPRRCLYMVDKKNKQLRQVAIGERRLDQRAIQQEKYIVVPEYPIIGKYEGGFRTIVHSFDGHGIWYGRPDSKQALQVFFREFMDDGFFLKSSANMFTGRAMLEVEADPIPPDSDLDDQAEDDGYVDLAAQFDYNMTNKSADPMQFMLFERPYGASASTLHQIQSNTPEGMFDFLSKDEKHKIIMAHQWSDKLLGSEQNQGWDSNQYLDILYIKRWGVIAKYQDKLSSDLKKCLNVIGDQYGFENNRRFLATTPFDVQLNEIKESKSAARKGIMQMSEPQNVPDGEQSNPPKKNKSIKKF